MKKRYQKFNFEESANDSNDLNDLNDLNEFIGFLKGKYNTIDQVKQCPRFIALSPSDKEYVIDELKTEENW
jgi:hypothetical protein